MRRTHPYRILGNTIVNDFGVTLNARKHNLNGIKFRGRCDKHGYCTDCKKTRGSNAGNRRTRRAAKMDLRKSY
jgi:hypothetical protein